MKRRLVALTMSAWLLGAAFHEMAAAAPGNVLSHLKISSTEGDFDGPLENNDEFGASMASMGFFDADTVGDLAVGAPGDDSGGGAGDRGAVWLLFLGSEGVSLAQKISAVDGGFIGSLDDGDAFGTSIASGFDIDDDAVNDLAVGATGDDDHALGAGAVWMLFLEPGGTVRTHQKISGSHGGFSGVLDAGDEFGAAVTWLGDLDGDNVDDIAVGAPGDDDGGVNTGAVWVLFLHSDGTVKASQKISSLSGGLEFPPGQGSDFGRSLASLPDLDGDSRPELIVGSPREGAGQRGGFRILFLDDDGTVRQERRIGDAEGGFGGLLNDGDHFGRSLSTLADVNDDGWDDLLVGAHRDGDGGTNRGAAWVVFLNGEGSAVGQSKISDVEGGFDGDLGNGDFFGRSVLGGIGGEGTGGVSVLVGSPGDDDGGFNRGAIWNLTIEDGEVSASTDGAESETATHVRMSGPFPNPAQRVSTIRFDLREPGRVDLTVSDASGRVVYERPWVGSSAGTHELSWDLTDRLGRAVPSGVFYMTLSSGGTSRTERVSVIR